MSDILKMILLVVTMAGVTYFIRMIPLAFFRKKIKSQYLRSVLYYIPFAVLSAMTFPYVFFEVGNIWAAVAGVVVAIVAALSKKSLLVVAILAVVTVFVVGLVI